MYKDLEKLKAYKLKNKKKISEYNRKYFLENNKKPEFRIRQNETLRKWRHNVKLDCIREYGGKCVCCGETTEEFLTLDHINNNGTFHKKDKKISDLMKWAKSNDYPKDVLRLMCFNCNCGRRIAKNKICPHARNNE